MKNEGAFFINVLNCIPLITYVCLNKVYIVCECARVCVWNIVVTIEMSPSMQSSNRKWWDLNLRRHGASCKYHKPEKMRCLTCGAVCQMRQYVSHTSWTRADIRSRTASVYVATFFQWVVALKVKLDLNNINTEKLYYEFTYSTVLIVHAEVGKNRLCTLHVTCEIKSVIFKRFEMSFSNIVAK